MTELENQKLDAEVLEEIPKEFEISYLSALLENYKKEKFQLVADYSIFRFLGRDDKKKSTSENLKQVRDAIAFVEGRLATLKDS